MFSELYASIDSLMEKKLRHFDAPDYFFAPTDPPPDRTLEYIERRITALTLQASHIESKLADYETRPIEATDLHLV